MVSSAPIDLEIAQKSHVRQLVPGATKPRRIAALPSPRLSITSFDFLFLFTETHDSRFHFPIGNGLPTGKSGKFAFRLGKNFQLASSVVLGIRVQLVFPSPTTPSLPDPPTESQLEFLSSKSQFSWAPQQTY